MSEVFEHDALEVVERAEARMQMDDDFAGAHSALITLSGGISPTMKLFATVLYFSTSSDLICVCLKQFKVSTKLHLAKPELSAAMLRKFNACFRRLLASQQSIDLEVIHNGIPAVRL
jgi:hypothetical protein